MMRRSLLSALVCSLSFGVACSSSTAPDTGGASDAVAPRDGASDAGLPPADAAGPRDALGRDGDPEEAGLGEDAAGPSDAAGLDAAELDGTAPGPDGGGADASTPDVGPSDAAAPDANLDPDASILVGGFDRRDIDNAIVHGQALEVIDLDGDGDRDVVAALSLTDSVQLYTNGGSGASWTKIDVAPPGTIVGMDVAVADFDGDGDRDVAAVGLFDRAFVFTSAGEVTWFENPGSGGGAWVRHPITGLTHWGARYIETADLTGDGRPDLVVGAVELTNGSGVPQASGVSWFANTGSGFSAARSIDATMRNAETVLIHDVDGDGVLDVIAVGKLVNEIAWYESSRAGGVPDANPTFTKHLIASPNLPYGLALANLDADPALELVVAYTDGAGALAFYDPPANPAQPWGTGTPIDATFGGSDNTHVTAADFNLDGRIDLGVSSRERNEIRAYLRDRSNGWVVQNVQTNWIGVRFVASGDIDGDGRPDLVTSTYNNDQMNSADRITWWRTQP